MKTFSNKITIVYRWFRSGSKDIKPEHIEALNESAQERIWEMIGKGYKSGELNDNIRMTDDDGLDGVEYLGWWETKETPQ